MYLKFYLKNNLQFLNTYLYFFIDQLPVLMLVFPTLDKITLCKNQMIHHFNI